MSLPIADLSRLAGQVAPEMVELRRDIHRHPEIGWEEKRTTAKVVSALRDLGLEPHVRATGTGHRADR